LTSSPQGFLTNTSHLSLEYGVLKAGCALTLDADEINKQLTISRYKSGSRPYERTYSVLDWESRYWRFKLQRSDELKVYAAPLDTTFAVYNKGNYRGSLMDAVRIGGDYAVPHLPWYPRLDTMSVSERAAYLKSNKSSTWVIR